MNIPKKGFTILELLVTIMILGILATLSIQHLSSSREMALEKEAISNLKLIIAGEKSYRLETESYITLANVGDINTNLGLALSGLNWEYQTVADNAATPPTVDARARRTVGTTPTVFCLDQDQDEVDREGVNGCAW
jgi:prepilin-type N-terminal cleavage/methylation domain-containing protein